MILDKQKGQKFFSDSVGDLLYLENPINADAVLMIKGGYSRISLLYERIRIDLKHIENLFEPVDNFIDLYYNQTKTQIQMCYSLYKHKTLDFYVSITRENYEEEFDRDEDQMTAGEGFRKIHGVYYQNDSKDLSPITEELNNILDFEYDSSSKVSIVLKTASGFQLKEVAIKPMEIDLATMYNDDFLPVYDHLTDVLVNGSKGVLLLYGDVGTGKSNLIRHLTTIAPHKRFVFVPNNMITALADPSFISTLVENKKLVLILEDCENFIRDRKTSGDSSVVGTILNLTDGILSDILGLQIICTFNSGLEDIDKALTRKGRLIDEYEFKALEKNKAEVLMKSLDVDPATVETTTLANIFNAKDASNRTKKAERKQIGFGK